MCDNRKPEDVANLEEYPFMGEVDYREFGHINRKGLYGFHTINYGSCCHQYVLVEKDASFMVIFPAPKGEYNDYR
jgi:hypothetical protein